MDARQELLRWLLEEGRLPGFAMRALHYVVQYYAETGRDTFTYRSLRRWWDERRLWRESEWHSVERGVRYLAEMGYLRRVGRGVFAVEAWVVEYESRA